MFHERRDPNHLRGLQFSTLRLILLRPEIPPRCLVPAGRALERQAPLLEVQERIVSVEAAEELSNLLANHYGATPFAITHTPV